MSDVEMMPPSCNAAFAASRERGIQQYLEDLFGAAIMMRCDFWIHDFLT